MKLSAERPIVSSSAVDHARRGEDAGGEGVDGHAAPHQVGRQCLDHVDHPGPGRPGVDEHRGAPLEREGVHHVDDGTGAGLGHRAP